MASESVDIILKLLDNLIANPMEPRIVFLKPKSIENLHHQKGSTLVYLNSLQDGSNNCGSGEEGK